MSRATSTFVIDSWDEEPALEEATTRLVRTRIGKTFSGDLVGTSIGEMVMAHADEGTAAYVGFERFSVTWGSREGSFLLLHHAVASPDGGSATWTVLDGSGTGGLAGISGTGEITRHDDGSHTFGLDATVPDAD